MTAVDQLRDLGCKCVAIASVGTPDSAAWKADGHLALGAAGDYDGVVVLDCFAEFMRALEPMQARGAIVVPAEASLIVPDDLRASDAITAAWNYSSAANYVARCGLRGHYLEFGTFWGSSFYRNYFQLRHWLQGLFYAFDSFQGLSRPLPEETDWTAGDFQAGAYFCNLASFRAIGTVLGVETDRMRCVPGFYSETLAVRAGADYGIGDCSVSVCVVDCDLLEPTRQVLDFVGPLLEDGALLYFDDWRLCRASARAGERAAALAWLREHPDYELIELSPTVPTTTGSWQSQWFIFQRN